MMPILIVEFVYSKYLIIFCSVHLTGVSGLFDVVKSNVFLLDYISPQLTMKIYLY